MKGGGQLTGFRGSEDERFWSKVNKSSGIFMIADQTECWVWTGAQIRGYGNFHLAGTKTNMLAHAWSFTQIHGPIEPGLEHDHLCRVRRCVRPSHIERVTAIVNKLRGQGYSGRHARKRNCPNGHLYDKKNNRGERLCSICTWVNSRKGKSNVAFLPPFERVVCDCEEDVAFCKAPAHLIPGDVFAIGEFLVKEGRLENVQSVFDLLRASKGAVVGEAATGKRFRIGTITPKVKDGQCVFLTEDKRCSIHSVAPFGCAFFSAHMDHVEGDIRSMWGLKQIVNTPAYETLRQKLIADSSEAEPFDSSSGGNNGKQTEGG